VSSAVLYSILGTALGLEIQGVMTRDHALVTLKAGNEGIDVETTNPYGFDPGNRREFHDAFGALTGFAYVPARNYRDRTLISRIELISLIFTNRISEMESRRRFGEAIPLAVNRAALLEGRKNPSPSPLFPDPVTNLMDRLFNYGASLIQGGQETEALRWAVLAGERYPSRRWEEFNYTALNNLFIKELAAGRIARARETLTRYAPRLKSEDARSLEALILDAELVKLSGKITSPAAAEAGLASVEAAEARSLLSSRRLAELKTFFLLKAGELRAAEAGWAAAGAYTGTLLDRYGPNRQVEEQLRTFRSNRVAELHNSFAAAYNRRDYAEARRIIAGALEDFPGNRQLLQDRELAERDR
jgi:hypothetical protein